MANKKQLDQMLQKRNAGPTREVVKPARLYDEAPETSVEANQKTSKPEKKQTAKSRKKFATYLKPESIRALKRIAIDEERNDYEVLQEAVDDFLAKRGRSASRE